LRLVIPPEPLSCEHSKLNTRWLLSPGDRFFPAADFGFVSFNSFRCMLNFIQSFWASASSYADMRPDFGLRNTINRTLDSQRASLTGEEWFERFWRPRGISKQIVDFVYERLGEYSGLRWGLTVPSDRLLEDLQLPLVCWFDWELSFCDDLAQQLGIQLEDPSLLGEVETVEEFLTLLHRKFA
jgi:hypothetical protein